MSQCMMLVSVVLFVFCAGGVAMDTSTDADCHGAVCVHGDVVLTADHRCVCQCKEDYAGDRCEYELKSSAWPGGRYTLVKSIEGCPEPPREYGWSEGYIKFIFTSPITVYVSSPSLNTAAADTQTGDQNAGSGTDPETGTRTSTSTNEDQHVGNDTDPETGTRTGTSTNAGQHVGNDTNPETDNPTEDGTSSTIDTATDNSSDVGLRNTSDTDINPDNMAASWRNAFNVGLFHVNLIGPFTDFTYQINFCTKQIITSTEELIGWPVGNYSVYKASAADCPEGFQVEYKNMTFRNVSAWYTDGHIPDYSISTDETGVVTLSLSTCRITEKAGGQLTSNESTFRENIRSFILLKGPEDNCSSFDGHNVSSEALMVVAGGDTPEHVDNDHAMLEYCVYVPENTPGRKVVALENGMQIPSDVFLTVQNCYKWAPEHHVLYEQSLGAARSLPDAEVYARHAVSAYQQILDNDVTPWIQIDFGASLDVMVLFGIDQMLIQHNYSIPRHVPDIYVSDDRWSFLSNGAEKVGHTTYTSIGIYVTLFTRTRRGTYVTLYGSRYKSQPDVVKYLMYINQLHVLFHCKPGPLEKTYVSDCQQPLGMTDHGIRDFQMTSSSPWLSSITPDMARPFEPGWCAQYNDPHPFFKVDLLLTILVEGIQITNVYLETIHVENGRLVKEWLPRGVRNFNVSYGISEEHLHSYAANGFAVDTSSSGPHTFRFIRAIYARYILIQPVHSLGITCFTFELIGCRRIGFPSLDCGTNHIEDMRKLIVAPATAFVQPSEPVTSQQTSSRDACIASCLEDTSTCGAIEYDNTTCNVYAPAIKAYYHVMEQPESDNKTWSQVMCFQDSISLRIPAEKSTALYWPTTLVSSGDVITSIGYPLFYASQMTYIWLVQLPRDRYISLTFTNISLFFPPDSVANCTDSVYLQEPEKVYFTERMYEVNYTYNGLTPTFALDVSVVTVTMATCRRTSPLVEHVAGFRAFVKSNDKAACRLYMCGEPSMRIASASYWGILTRRGETQSWLIQNTDGTTLYVTFTHFYVRCDSGSVLEVTTSTVITKYCNANRPPTRIVQSGSPVRVSFLHSQRFGNFLYEGFHLTYWHEEPVKRDEIDFGISKRVCDADFGKCYTFHHAINVSRAVSWWGANERCASNGQKMVSFVSKDEQEVVRSYVNSYSETVDEREYGSTSNSGGFSYFGGFSRSDPTFYMYIGLVGFENKDLILQEEWLSGLPLTFTDWSTVKPPSRLNAQNQCTRILYDLSTSYYSNDRWETVDCDHTGEGAASYFVCEEPYNPHGLSERGVGVNVTLTAPQPSVMDSSSMFHCETGEWISVLSLCNGVKECLGGEDELNCLPSNGDGDVCSGADQFRCTNGKCIHVSRVCDNVEDCDDTTDEKAHCSSVSEGGSFIQPCSLEVHWLYCGGFECIPHDLKCDGVQNCLSGADEEQCVSCKSGTFRCDITLQCIPAYRVCDGYVDCRQDHSDEINCDLMTFDTCASVWEAGFSKTGIYRLGNKNVECDFSEVITSNIITARLYDISTESNFMMSGNAKMDSEALREFALIHTTLTINQSCHINVYQLCNPALTRVMEHDGSYGRGFETCECVYQSTSIPIEDVESVYKFCETGNETDESGRQASSVSLMTREIKADIQVPEVHPKDMLFSPGPAQCRFEYFPKEEVLLCANGFNTFTQSQRCHYQIDALGTVAGCRDLYHLQNCEGEVCREGYVKCPDSYCIEQRLVCDGTWHCPRGQDETHCRDTTRDSNINIVYMEGEDETIMFDLAKQFYTNSRSSTISFLTVHTATSIIQPNANTNDWRSHEWRLMLHVCVLNYQSFVLQQAFACYRNALTVHLNSDTPSLIEQLPSNSNHSKQVLIYAEGVQNTWRAGVSDTMMPSLIAAMTQRPADAPNMHVYTVRYDNTLQGRVARQQTDGGVIEVRYDDAEVLSSLGPGMFEEIVSNTKESFPCDNGFLCEASRLCLPLSQVCDYIVHCPLNDDELLCRFECPWMCRCTGFYVNCENSGVTMAVLDYVALVATKTRSLDLSNNPSLGNAITAPRNVSEDDYPPVEDEAALVFDTRHLHLPHILYLNLSGCAISSFASMAFSMAQNLLQLDISYNTFETLPAMVFGRQHRLTRLMMHGNRRLRYIHPFAFTGLLSITELNIVGTSIETLHPNTFSGLKLNHLDLSNNMIKTVDGLAFNDLASSVVKLEFNAIQVFDNDMFTGLSNVATLRTPAYRFCCIRPMYLDEGDCYPRQDEFSSCQDLMRSKTLQALLWVIGITSLLGNVCSLIYRLKFDRKRLNLGYGIFVTNLAISDFMMGVYMMIIAIADAVYRDRYILFDEVWRNGNICTLAGILATVSSESSVLFMCLITLDRIIIIKYPFGKLRFRPRSAIIAGVICWIIAISMAIAPVLFPGYFEGKFYSRSAVCLALPLTKDKPPGWKYSIALFVGFNFATFVLIAIGQCLLYTEIKKQSSKIKRKTARSKDLVIARNLFIVVATDFLCWFPIGCMGLMALLGYSISGDVYAWAAVLVLPINSALNPFLYTLSAIVAKKSFNPSIDEQRRSQNSKEISASVFKFWKRQDGFFRLTSTRGKDTRDFGDTDVHTLSELCAGKQVTPTMSALILYRTVYAMRLLHKWNIIHGHIKPEHIEVSMSSNQVLRVRIHVLKEKCSVNGQINNDVYDIGGIARTLLAACRSRNASM